MLPKGLFILILIFLTSSLATSSPYSVRTKIGTVNGFVDDTAAPDVAQFLGIPFAEPPIASRRWLPPIAKANADSAVIDGTRLGLSCPQYDSAAQTVYNSDAPQFNITPNRTSEDCLSLNIWAPARGTLGFGQKLPVFVWLYGGGFQAGGGDVEYQIPVNWVQRSQGHIVVGINYRVNIFGFPNAAGLNLYETNLGLLDQRLGIEWVRDNIASFGGDISRIALWGQSAGAASVDYYNYAYAQDPIVSCLIMDSGNAFLPISPYDPTHASFTAVASRFNCSTDPAEQVACLRKIPQEEVIRALATTPNVSFNPVPDGRTRFTNYTRQTLERKFSGLPAIVGTNANEGVSLVGPYPKDPAIAGPNQTEANAVTLNWFLCPAAEATKLRYRVGAKTYQYLYAGNFSNVSPRNWLGTYHSSEVPLIMGTSGQFRGNNTEFEDSVSEKMQDFWVAFARDPLGGLDKAGWDAYEPGGDAVVFGLDDVVMGRIGSAELEAPCDGVVGRKGVAPPLAPRS